MNDGCEAGWARPPGELNTEAQLEPDSGFISGPIPFKTSLVNSAVTFYGV